MNRSRDIHHHEILPQSHRIGHWPLVSGDRQVDILSKKPRSFHFYQINILVYQSIFPTSFCSDSEKYQLHLWHLNDAVLHLIDLRRG